MKKFLKIIFIAGFFFSCSASLLLPTISDVTVAKKYWSDADSLSLRQGYYLYVNKCGACHTLYNPAKFPEEKWKKEVPLMMPRAKINEQQVELILRYILTKRETILAGKK
jgi:mono/diheme cytochrome c family protein